MIINSFKADIYTSKEYRNFKNNMVMIKAYKYCLLKIYPLTNK